MTKHKCITDLSANFYKSVKDLVSGEDLIVTNRGKPEYIITKTNDSVCVSTHQEQSTPNSYSYSSETMSAFNSNGYNKEEANLKLEMIKNLLGIPQLPKKEVKNEEKEHTHK